MMLLFLFLLQTVLIVSTKVNIYPELFYFPWLVAKGHIPYMDFFDHHGFLLYYVLAPFTNDVTLRPLIAVHYLLQTVTLVAAYAAFKQTLHGVSLFFAGLLFVILNFYLVGGNMWYESFISLLYISLYYSLIRPVRYRSFLIALCISSASMIKPTSGAIIVPTLLYTQSIIPLVLVGMLWTPVFAFYLLKGGLFAIYDNLIAFNSFFGKYMLEQKVFFMKPMFLALNGIFLSIGLLAGFNKKPSQTLLTSVFFITSLIHVIPRFEYSNLIPAVPFFCLLVVSPISFFKSKEARNFYTACVAILLLYLVQQTYFVYPWMQHRMTYIEADTRCNLYQHVARRSNSFYVFANQPELYFFSDMPLKIYHPLMYPWYKAYYPQLENRIIHNIENNDVGFILVPTVPDERFAELDKLEDYVNKHYVLIQNDLPCAAQNEGV